MVCQRWCVKDGVSKMVRDNVVCQRWCVTKLCVKDAVSNMVGPSAPPKPAQCHKCHACHAKRRWMSPSATPATRKEGGCRQVPHLPRRVPRRHQRHRRTSAPKRAQARPSAPKRAHASAIGAKPATQNQGGCTTTPNPYIKLPF